MDANSVAAFYALFSGSERSFTTFKPLHQTDERGKALGTYQTLSRAPTLDDYQQHLEGRLGLVVAPIHNDGTSVFGVLDVDLDDYRAGAEYVNELRKRVVLEGLPLQYFASKSGGAHFVLFLDSPQPTPIVRKLLFKCRDLLGLQAEVFPKQDQLSPDGKGNSVNLPFFGDLPGFEAWLKQFKPTTALELEQFLWRQAAESTSVIGRTKLPRLLKGVDFEEELIKAGLKYWKREVADGVQYNYHGVSGQGCLLKGGMHLDQRTNTRQSQFIETKNREVFHRCFDSDCQGISDNKTRLALRALGLEGKVLGVTDGSDWREHCLLAEQLSTVPPKFLLGGLVPEKALTLIVASAYHGKTWFALQSCLAMARGVGVWGFDAPEKPVKIIYHVPEMNEGLVAAYARKLGYADVDVLFRPMERGLWPLDNPRMLQSAKDRLVVLDTVGYFNPADDTNAYNQSLKFANLIYNLMNEGALGVVGLYHVPKYARDEKGWTLETSVLGSAGYGGILRSCLRLKNLNPDLNDPNIHVYVQGLKNPGLKPFQLEGVPLRLKVAPGDSPYLSQLEVQAEPPDPNYYKATQLFCLNKSLRDVEKELGVGKSTAQRWRKRWEQENQNTSLLSEEL